MSDQLSKIKNQINQNENMIRDFVLELLTQITLSEISEIEKVVILDYLQRTHGNLDRFLAQVEQKEKAELERCLTKVSDLRENATRVLQKLPM